MLVKCNPSVYMQEQSSVLSSVHDREDHCRFALSGSHVAQYGKHSSGWTSQS